jgi:hypothetical protein
MRAIPASILCAFFACALVSGGSSSLEAQAARQAPSFRGEKPAMIAEAEALSALRYGANERYVFDASLRARLGLLFEREQVKAALTVEYLDGLGLGESYLRGGAEYSNIQIGLFVEDWGSAFSRGLSSVLNERDDRYPDNIFFSKKYRPNPIFSMTVGGEGMYAQAALSNREVSIESIEDSDFGLRGVVRSGAVRATGGLIKRIGASSLLSFATLEQETAGGRQWVEVDWQYLPSAEDVWSMAVGFSRELSFSRVWAEYLLLDTEDVVFLEEDLRFSDAAGFDLKLYFHLPDFSTALSGFFILGVGEGLTFEPGIYGFFGRRGRYFSPTEAENDNRAVIRLRFLFG